MRGRKSGLEVEEDVSFVYGGWRRQNGEGFWGWRGESLIELCCFSVVFEENLEFKCYLF